MSWAAIALGLGLLWILNRQARLQFGIASRRSAGYLPLQRDRQFLRHALSQAFNLGALLIIVFAAPTLVTRALSGQLSDFVIMQLLGICFFVLMANIFHLLVERFGDSDTIFAGSCLTALGCLGVAGLGVVESGPC